MICSWNKVRKKKKSLAYIIGLVHCMHSISLKDREKKSVLPTKQSSFFFYRRCCCFVAVVVSLLSSRKKTEGKTSKSWKRINYMLGVVVVIAMFSRILFFLLLLVHTHTH